MHEEVTLPELTEVVVRLAALLGPRQGSVVQLEGGITNRNFRVNLGGTDYVVRLPGKRTELLGIDRESERVATKAAAALAIAPRVAAMFEQPPCLVTSYIPGRGLSAQELRRPEAIDEVARGLRSFHESGAELPSTFDPLRLVQRYAGIAREHGTELPDSLDEACERARTIVEAVAGHPEHAPVPCHDDLLTANFLHDGERIQLIDWEYAGMGDRYFDLGNLAVNNGFEDEHEERLLGVYFGGPPDERRRAALKLFRFVSDLREAMWGTVQSTLSAVRFDFPDYARRHFSRLRETGADPRFPSWIEDVRG
jgi:thiamine kinase-like enzyme